MSSTFHLLRYPAFELREKVIGVVGFGAIGRKVARIAKAFGMKVLVHDRGDLSGTGYANSTLGEVLSNANMVTVHCPLTDRTRNLIDAESLRMMKPTALLFNTARGGIVNEHDLAECLRQGTIAGAGVDTLTAEPPAGGNPLLADVPNVVITPHVAWASREARQRLMDGVIENIHRFREGRVEGFVV
jgi:glycerate dehydrogenase